MDDLRLDAIEARANAATEGPWRLWDGWGPTDDGLMGFARLGPEAGDRVLVHDDQRDLYARHEDAEFIAHAREDVPALVAEVRRLRAERDAARTEVMAELLDARRRAEGAERRAGDAEKHLIDSAGFDMADLMRSLDECVDRAEQAEATVARVREMVDQPAVILNPREVIVRYENIRRTVVRYENIQWVARAVASRALDGDGVAS